MVCSGRWVCYQYYGSGQKSDEEIEEFEVTLIRRWGTIPKIRLKDWLTMCLCYHSAVTLKSICCNDYEKLIYRKQQRLYAIHVLL